MADIIPLKPASEKELQVWCCAHCDSSAFTLLSDGTTECRGCGHTGEYPDGRWGTWTPVDEEEPRVQRATAIYDSAAFAQKAVIKSVSEETSVLVVASDNGRIRAWSEHNHTSSPEAKATVRYLMAQATSLILGEEPLDRPDDALEETK